MFKKKSKNELKMTLSFCNLDCSASWTRQVKGIQYKVKGTHNRKVLRALGPRNKYFVLFLFQ